MYEMIAFRNILPTQDEKVVILWELSNVELILDLSCLYPLP